MQGMAEKDAEKTISKKPKRKFSRKGTTKATASTPPLETTSPVKFRSATLPLSTDPRALAFHEPHNDGIFSRLRRRFRLGSKGKYDLNLQPESSPTKSRWLRRKSEEAQCQPDSNIGIPVDATHAVTKSNSVRTQRKTKSDKEEVILVRKDKRVSVICKAKNGEAEVIFSNVKNSGEDLAVSDTEEEDPYATISSVNKECKNTSYTNDIVTNEFSVALKAAVVVNGSDKSCKVEDVDEYPYAKIKPGRNKFHSASDHPMESQNFKQTGFLLDKAKMEPDYESLDEIKQKQHALFHPGEKYTSIQNTLASSSSTKITFPISADLDPDYESLEEVKHRCLNCKLSSHSHLQEETTMAPSAPVMNRLSKTDTVGSSCEGFQSGSSHSLVKLSAHLDGDSHSQVSSATQGSKTEYLSRPHDGDRSPEVRAPLASSIDSTLAMHSQEECYYDNPNVILRKNISRSITNTCQLSRRINSHSETVTKKSPAEGELVEDLINRLAPPLPLRNYQKDEIFSRGASGSSRHSWSSLTNRYADIGENHQVREEDRGKSPTSGTHPSRGNLILKSVKDSFVSQIYDRHDRSPRGFGNKELSLEHLQKHSPMFIKSNLISDNNRDPCSSDYPILDKSKQKPCLKTHLAESLGKESASISLGNCDMKSESQVNFPLNQSSQKLIIDFSGVLAKYVVQEACRQCSHLKKPVTQHCCSNNLNPSNASNNNMLSLSVPKQDQLVGTVKNTEKESVNCRTEQHSERSPKYILVSSPGSSSNDLVHNILVQPQVQTGHGQDEGKTENNIFVGESPQTDHCLFEPISNTLLNEHIRPNVESLHLELKTNGFSESQDQLDCSHSVSINGGHESDMNSSVYFITRSQDSEAWDEAMSPAFSDLDFSDSIHEHISADNQPGDTASFDGLTSSQVEENNQFLNADIQKTIFIDLELDTEMEAENIQRIHTPVILMKPVVYANPRLLENVISGIFTKVSGLDSAYLAHGVFKWGRYFPNLVEKKQVVETKMKAFFSFILKMLLSPDRIKRHEASVRKLQEEMDMLQLKIEKHLKDIQNLPTFHNVRLHLLGTDIIDSWQPDIPKASYFDQHDPGWLRHKSSSHLVKNSCYQPECEDFLKDPLNKIEVPTAMSTVLATVSQTLDIGDILHSEEPFPDVDETLNDFQNGQSILNLPATSAEVLDEFVKLSESRLGCRHCSTTEESDSEDEMVTVEAYSRTVSNSSYPQSSSPTEHISSVSLCRALHGELAYMTRIRKHRAPRKLLNVPGPDSECQGAESHLSWHHWCSMDELFRKLIPYVSPRLDFQYLLRTYAEFKHFVLVNRKRNLEHRGCFLTSFPDQTTKCCRFEEFVFLKILRDEVRYFSHVLCTSTTSKDLFLEERDIGYSLLGLLRLLLRNIHKTRRSLSKEEVGPMDLFNILSESGDYKVYFRHSSFLKWPEEEFYFTSDTTLVNTDSQKFHLLNYENFRCGSLSQALRDWKSPQTYVRDPNVLDSCQTMFGQWDTKSLEIKGVEEPRPLQEQQDFMESLEQLQQKDWYWGPISYEQATLILSSREDGSFLVRDSSDQKYLLSLSFKSLGEVHHTRIEHAKGLFSFWSQPDSHGKARICEFIEKSIQNSRDGRFLYFLRPSARGTPPLPIRLLTPVSRNFRVSSLKHLSRFVVRQHVRKDHLDLLPIPEKVKRYLRDKQYYVEILGDDQWALDGYCGSSLN